MLVNEFSSGDPVIASDSAGSYWRMIDVVKQAGASAVAAETMFHFTEQTPAQAKIAMANAGISVRHPSNGLRYRMKVCF